MTHWIAGEISEGSEGVAGRAIGMPRLGCLGDKWLLCKISGEACAESVTCVLSHKLTTAFSFLANRSICPVWKSRTSTQDPEVEGLVWWGRESFGCLSRMDKIPSQVD